jgi:hypothetical protein
MNQGLTVSDEADRKSLGPSSYHRLSVARESQWRHNEETAKMESTQAATGPSATAPIDIQKMSTFAEFYPFYLGEHSNLACRRLHFLGSSLGLVCVGMVFATGNPLYLLLGLLCGYACAWVGHFGFEKNKPASFKRPLYSFMGDWVMYKDMWTGKVKVL